VEKLEAKMARIPEGEPLKVYKSAGQRFVESEEFKSAVAGKKFETGSVEVGSLFRKQINDALVGAGFAGPVWPDMLPNIVYEEGHRVMTIRDIMNVAPTTSNAISYFKETEDFQKESAKSQKVETATKEQVKMGFEPITTPVETIGAWIPASRQVLSDSAMLQGHIDTRLTYKVLKEYEDQILFGSGVDGELEGIHNYEGVQTVGYPTGDQTALDLLRLAFARVRVNEYFATAVILNPNDWARLELLKGTDDRYVWVSVPDGGQPRIWRVPVVETTAMEEYRFLTGAFGIGAQLFEREGASVRISEHHSDYFVRNAVAILAEMRAALAVYRASAFIKGTFSKDLST
jgi:HK97 family phage major capsid protein